MLPGVQPAGPSAGETQSGDWMAAEPGVAPARRAGRPFLALSVVAALAAAAMIAVIALVGIAVLWRGDSPGSPGAPDPIASVPSVATAPAEAVPPAPAVAPPVAASEEAPGVEVDASRRATATTRATGRPAPRDPAVVAPEAISPVAEAEAEPAVPEETPTPVATTALGTIRVTGDATRVVLDGPNGRARPGPVVAGTYSVRATFADGSEAPGETFAVRAGQVVTLECSATFLICRVKR
jgi:hypothetical protein